MWRGCGGGCGGGVEGGVEEGYGGGVEGVWRGCGGGVEGVWRGVVVLTCLRPYVLGSLSTTSLTSACIMVDIPPCYAGERLVNDAYAIAENADTLSGQLYTNYCGVVSRASLFDGP